MADRPQPQLHPEHPLELLLARQRQAFVDHRPQQAVAAHGAQVPGLRERVLERFGQQGLAGGEVVVHERRRDARVHRDACDAHGVDAVARDPADRGVEDPLARALGHGTSAVARRKVTLRSSRYASATMRSKWWTVISAEVNRPRTYPREPTPFW